MVNGTNATYKANVTSAGYTLSSDAKNITYSSESTENTLSISGLKGGLSVKNGISIKDNVINAKGKDINITDNYNQTQIYSRTLEILYDNNFIADEFELDDIFEVTDKNYSVGEIENSCNVNELANNPIVTASSFDEK